MMAVLERAARALLECSLPRELRDPVIGDIDDEAAELGAAGRSGRQVGRWRFRQYLRSVPAALRLRWRPRRRFEMRRAQMFGATIHDVKYALRLLRRSPLFALSTIGTLALGIGATTAIFSVAHATLLRPLPFPEAEQIVSVYETFRNNSLSRGVANPSNFDYWERHSTVFAHLAALRSQSATLTGAGDAARVRVQLVTPAFFDVMRVRPALGRPLVAADATESGAVLLSHDLWTARFSSDAAITARSVTLNGTPRPVAGVMPPGFRHPSETQVWGALDLPPALRAEARSWFLGVIGRLKPGVTPEQAQAEMAALAGQLQTLHPARQKDRGVRIIPLRDDLVFRFADGVRLLQGAVVVVLLIAIANIANLLLANGAGRRREFSVRSAIGAGRGRVVRQALTESLVIGVTGAAAGALLAHWGVRALTAASPIQLPAGMEPAVDGPVLAFALLLGLSASVLFGLAPALAASNAEPAAVTKEHTTSAGGGTASRRLRGALVIAEVALAVVLLVGAGLLIRSFASLTALDTGFEAANVLTASTNLPSVKYRTPEQRRQAWEALFERLRALPDVVSAGGSTAVPFSNWEWQTDFRVAGRESVANDGAGIRTVHPRFFDALSIPVVAGRGLDATDVAEAEPVALVNETFARRHLAGLDPVGQRLTFPRTPELGPVLIVGVVRDTRHFRLEQAPQAEIYRPMSQEPPQTFVLALRTSGDPRAIIPLVRSTVREVDPDLPVDGVATLDGLVGRTVAQRRFYMALMAVFSALALVLAAIGVYGVMAFTVGQRTREIGIRVALGANPAQVERMVLSAGGALTIAGLVIGMAGAMASARVIESALFGVTKFDPLTLAAVVALLGGFATLASYVPARRARRLDPIVALRRE